MLFIALPVPINDISPPLYVISPVSVFMIKSCPPDSYWFVLEAKILPSLTIIIPELLITRDSYEYILPLFIVKVAFSLFNITSFVLIGLVLIFS